MSFLIRLLKPNDGADYRNLRLHALQNFPTYYGTSYEDAIKEDHVSFVKMIKKHNVFGAYLDKELSAIAIFAQAEGKHMEHYAHIYQVYVKKDKQSLGIGTKLMNAIIEHAKIKVRQIYIAVCTHNEAAISLYKKLDFEIYGVEPKKLYINNIYYDEYLMVKFFDKDR